MNMNNIPMVFLFYCLLLPKLVFGVSHMTHVKKSVTTVESFSHYNKISISIDYLQTLPFQGDLPTDSPDDVCLLTSDIEEIVDMGELYHIMSFNCCVFYSRVIVFRYKEQDNLQFKPDIVPPPPKM